MILLPHIITGAMIGAKTKNLGLIIILGILSHFILDKIPHWDYSINGIKDFRKTRNFKKLVITLIKIGIDGLIGLLIVSLTLWQKDMFNSDYLLFILLGIFASVLPDILGILSEITNNNFLNVFTKFHDFAHFKTEKEGELTFLGLFTQIAVIICALVIFFL
jgi:hypothetical protein